jgi:hypothetical protein
MKKQCGIWLTMILLLAGSAMVARADDTTFSLLNGGIAVASQGQTTGWGYTLSETGPDYLVVDSFQFCADASCFTIPGGGTFTDYSGYNFYTLGPAPDDSLSYLGTTTTEPWVLDTTGAGDFSILPSTPPGDINGYIVLTYDLFSCDPTSGSCANPTDTSSLTLAAPATVEVTPEPNPALLLMTGLVLGAFLLASRSRVMAGKA